MPLCPRCHDEFQASVATCPDCEVPLVEALETGADQPHLSPVLVLVEDPALRDEVASCLQRAQAPNRAVEDGFEIPLGLAQSVLSGLAGLFELAATEDERVFLLTGHRVLAPGPDPTILDRPFAELVAAGEAAVADLRALLRDGDAEQRRRASARLGRLQAEASLDLSPCLLEAIQAGHRGEVFACCDLLKAAGGHGLARRVCELLDGLDPARLSLALHVIGQHPDPEVADRVIDLLEHESAEVRAEADEVLCWASGKDMGFDADASESERALAVARWREWAVQD